MLSKLGQFFKEPPAKELIADEEKVKKDYTHWRLRIFYSCFIGYTIFYLCKKIVNGESKITFSAAKVCNLKWMAF